MTPSAAKQILLRKVYRATQSVSVDLVTIQRTLFDAGLYSTAKMVSEASRRLGWEAAEKIERLTKKRRR